MGSKRDRGSKLPPISDTVTVTVEGQEFSGRYYVEGSPPMVTVVSPYGSDSKHQGRSPAKTIAGMILSRMVQSFRRPGTIREDLRDKDGDSDND